MNILFASLFSSFAAMLVPQIDALGVAKIQELSDAAQKPTTSTWTPSRDAAEVFAIMTAMQLLNTLIQKVNQPAVAAPVVAPTPTEQPIV